VLNEMPKDDAAAVQRSIEATRPNGRRALGAKTLTRLLREAGIEIGERVVRRHQDEGRIQ
jgi:repressor of nif and glnA expression